MDTLGYLFILIVNSSNTHYMYENTIILIYQAFYKFLGEIKKNPDIGPPTVISPPFGRSLGVGL